MRRRDVWSAALAVALVGGLGAGVVSEQASAAVTKTTFTTTGHCAAGRVTITVGFTDAQFVNPKLAKAFKGTRASAAGYFTVSGEGLRMSKGTVVVAGGDYTVPIGGSRVPTLAPTHLAPPVRGIVRDNYVDKSIKVELDYFTHPKCTVELTWTRKAHGLYATVTPDPGVVGEKAQFYRYPGL